MKARWFAVFLLLSGPTATRAHIGNPTTIHEGFAGAVPVRVSRAIGISTATE